MAIIISSDKIKKTFSDYSPDKAEDFHRKSAKLADKEFTKILKTSNLNKVILMNGGSASGKTEFVLTHLSDEPAIIFDTTLSTIKGAEIKIKRILKAHKTPEIYSVIPDRLTRAFIAFLHRDRKFSDDHFYRTHSGSRETLLWIVKNYPDIKVKIIESSYTKKDTMVFNELKFASKKEFSNFLKNIQLSEPDIINQL